MDNRIAKLDARATNLKQQIGEIQQGLDKCKQDKQTLVQYKRKHEQEGKRISDQYASEQAHPKTQSKGPKDRANGGGFSSGRETQDLLNKLLEVPRSKEVQGRIHHILQQALLEVDIDAKQQRDDGARQQQDSNREAFRRSTLFQNETEVESTTSQAAPEQGANGGVASGGADLSTAAIREASSKEKRARDVNSSSKSRSPHRDSSNGGKRREHSPGQTICAAAAAARKESQHK